MSIINSFEQVREHINRIRGLRKGFLTNFFPEQRKIEIWCSHNLLTLFETEDVAIFLKKNEDFIALMYCATNVDELFDAIALLPRGKTYVVDQIIDARTDSLIINRFIDAGFNIRKSFVRMSKINSNPSSNEIFSDTCVYESDIPMLHRLLQSNFDKYSEQLPSLEELKDFVDEQHVIVKRIDDKIAGFIIYDQTPSTLYLRYWLVNHRYRNKGVGSYLFKEYTRRGDMCKRHMLWVMDDNENAIVRYRHYGYSEENIKNYVLTFNLN